MPQYFALNKQKKNRNFDNCLPDVQISDAVFIWSRCIVLIQYYFQLKARY